MKNVDLIILCGGFGTRLKTISKNTPKILCKINEKPFLEHLLKKILLYNVVHRIAEEESAGSGGECLVPGDGKLIRNKKVNCIFTSS